MPTMPNLVGVDCWQALATLIAAGITPNIGLVPNTSTPTIGYFDDWPVTFNWAKANAKPGFVTAQSPASGTADVAYNAAITLTVAAFPFAVADKFTAGGYS